MTGRIAPPCLAHAAQCGGVVEQVTDSPGEIAGRDDGDGGAELVHQDLEFRHVRGAAQPRRAASSALWPPVRHQGAADKLT